MAEPISVAARRGGTVESIHRVHAVAVRDGKLVGSAGDAGLVTFMRSAAKPIQALPLARERDDLDERDLAIASASHLADEAQLGAVQALLDKAPATEDDLECGPEGNPPRRINHNCSGKHAGMLALCRAKGWSLEGYRLAEHPCQRAMLAEVTAVAATKEIATAVDGCGVESFALPLEAMALAFSRLEGIDGGGRVAAAMRAHPELIRGPRGLDTNLMQAFPGWIAKGGAEGLLCASAPDGLGLALKVEDGSTRALRPALGAFLESLELEGSGFVSVPVCNSRNEVVGELAAY
jgi:L-asparaginase II